MALRYPQISRSFLIMSNSFSSILAQISGNLPAYERLIALQKLAIEAGWRWPSIVPALDKTEEELGEVREAIATGSRAEIVAELGDLVFMSTLLCHYACVDPQEALASVTDKFARRFGYIEQRAYETGRSLNEVPHDEERRWYAEYKQLEKARA